MALKLSVKIGDVTNLSDARYAAGMGVDYIGFNINASTTNYITPKVFKEIVNWISGVGVIGEIGKQTPDSVDEYPTYLTETTDIVLAKSTNDAIFRINAKGLSIEEINNQLSLDGVHFFIIELTPNQVKDSVQQLAELCTQNPIYISTDFDESILESVVNNIKPKGIEIKGGLEDQPGFKDYDDIADVLEWLEEED